MKCNRKSKKKKCFFFIDLGQNVPIFNFGSLLRSLDEAMLNLCYVTLRGLNFADHSIREILTLSRGFNFADGLFRHIFRISGMGLVHIFRKFRGSIRPYLKQEAEIRKIRTNYETKMIFTFEKLAKAYVLYRIKTISLFQKKLKISRNSLIFQIFSEDLISRMAQLKFFAGT